MQRPLHPFSFVRWIAFVLILVATGIGVWELWTDRRSSPDTAGATGASEEQGVSPPGSQSANDPSRPGAKPQTPQGVATALARTPAGQSGIQRGPNNQRVFAEPRLIERHAIAGTVFREDLMQVRDGPPDGPLTLNKYTLSAVEAEFDPALVQRFLASNAGSLRIPLDARRFVAAVIERVITRGPVTNTFVGKVDGNPQSEVLLVFHDGAVSGSVAFYDTNEHYEFGMAGNGKIAIRRLDPAAFTAECGNPGIPPHTDEEAAAEPPGQSAASLPAQSTSSNEEADATVVMDTVVGYGQGARIADGGAAAIEARIIASVDRMNTAFANSQISGIEVVLLGTVEDPDYIYPGAVSGDMGSADELGDLNSTTDGNLDTVTDLRDSLGADTAAFVIEDTDGSAGIAYRPGRSMVVARTYMASTRITYAHEFAHNIGCRHAWGDTSSDTVTDTNFGWRLNPPSSGQVRTIMAYDWNWTRIPYYSNPNVQYAGANTGAADGYDAAGDATADPRAVSGGYTGTAGGGYDGTNSGLGARNADYIIANAQFVADNASRPAPEIEVEQPAGTALTDDASTITFNSPSKGTPVVLTFTIRNTGSADLTGLAITKDGANGAEFSVGAPGVASLAPGGSTTFAVTFTPFVTGERLAAIHIASNDADENPFDIALSGAVRVAIAAESFETGMGAWSTSSGFDFNWTRNSGATPSNNTGPSGASDGNYYIFTESSNPNYPSKTAAIEATFDFTGYSGVQFHFDYHMHGSDMGTLSLDVFDGIWHLDAWTRTGEQHADETTPWSSATVDLSDYDDSTGIVLRIRGVTGGNFRSDMAVDSITILGSPLSHTLTYISGPNGSLSGNTLQAVLDGQDGSAVEAVPDANFHFVNWSDSLTSNPRTDSNVTADITVTANFAADVFNDWANAAGLSGSDALPTAIPFGDGVANLLKYAFNLDGTGPDTRHLVPGTGTSGLPVFTYDESGPSPVFRLEYLRRKSGDATYNPLQSATLQAGSWITVTGTISITDIDATWERVTIEIPDTGSTPQLFFKIDVSLD